MGKLFPTRSLVLAVRAGVSLGGEADVGGGGDFDELNTTSEDGHCCEDINAGLDDFPVADEVQSVAKHEERAQDKQPASNFSSF